MAEAISLWPLEPPATQAIAAPPRMLVPLGARLESCCQAKPPGAAVDRGESVARIPLESSHIPLSPVTGKLGEIFPITLTNGQPTRAVEVFVESHEERPLETDTSPLTTLVAGIDRLRRAGVWADRHGCPDLIGQLNQIVLRPVEAVICTVLDADAGLRLGAMLAATQSRDLVAGVSQAARLAGARRVVIAYESYTPQAWLVPLRNAVYSAGPSANLTLMELPNDYPQADPTLMLYSIANRRLRPGHLPTSQGVLLIDAAAAVAIGRGVREEKFLAAPLAVFDHIQNEAHFLRVPIGTSVGQALEAIGIGAQRCLLRGGDLLRDVRLNGDAIIAGGELTVHVTPPEAVCNPQPCIRCGWCLEACPTRVQPAGVLEAAQRDDMDMANAAGLTACIECGLCSHVCPSRLPLLESVRYLRKSTGGSIPEL
ncbi:MAG: 4Fe-4S dicluster domain-containing protein [Tepidisphaeraceae bacterium]|jgi:electron transport complex protein RnfC